MSTILPAEMVGVAFISGFRGVGKSFLASQADLPQNIAFFDFENKGEGIDAQLDFGTYRALTQEANGDPLNLYHIANTAFNELPTNAHTTLILDNVSPFELAMNAEASNRAEYYAERYGLNLKNIKAGRFGGTRAIVNMMISDLTSRLHSKGIQLIICTSHISSRWGAAGPIPNKYNIKGADRWQELSILTLILIPGDKPPVPSALVQKEQLGTIAIPRDPTPEQLEAMKRGETGHTISRRLPPKISECTFQAIRKYLHTPADFTQLTAGEKPSFEESDPFDAKLSKEQFAYMQNAIAVQDREQREAEEMLEALANVEQQNNVNELVAAMNGYTGVKAPMPISQYLASQGKKCDMATAVAVMQQLKG